MQNIKYLSYFQKKFPNVSTIEISGLHEPILFWEDWFCGFYWNPEEPNRLRVQFKFNFSQEEQNYLKQAEAMGLLAFHFYQTISDRVKKEAIDLIHWTDPLIRSHFLLVAADLDTLLNIFDKIRKQHAIITETALGSLSEIVSAYKLQS